MAVDDLLAQVHSAGGQIMMVEHRLKVRAPEPLPDELVADLRRHKAEIIALLLDRKAAWTPEDWRAFFDERAAIAQHSGVLPRAEAEARAYENCIVEWMNRNFVPCDPGGCAWCGETNNTGSRVLPFGTESHGHTWLHSSCWPMWYAHRVDQAVDALAFSGVVRTGMPGVIRGSDDRQGSRSPTDIELDGRVW